MLSLLPILTKVEFFLETRQKIFSPMVGKLNLNFHLPGCPADTSNDAKIQIQFSRHWTKDFLAGF